MLQIPGNENVIRGLKCGLEKGQIVGIRQRFHCAARDGYGVLASQFAKDRFTQSGGNGEFGTRQHFAILTLDAIIECDPQCARENSVEQSPREAVRIEQASHDDVGIEHPARHRFHRFCRRLFRAALTSASISSLLNLSVPRRAA